MSQREVLWGSMAKMFINFDMHMQRAKLTSAGGGYGLILTASERAHPGILKKLAQ